MKIQQIFDNSFEIRLSNVKAFTGGTDSVHILVCYLLIAKLHNNALLNFLHSMTLEQQQIYIAEYKNKVNDGELIIENDNRITDLVGFSKIQDLIPIKRLVIRNCQQFENLSGIGDLQDSLEILIIDNTGLRDTRQFARINYIDKSYNSGVIHHLELTNNKNLEVIEGIRDDKKNFQTVKTLILHGNGLKSFQGIRPLRFVEYLDLSDNYLSNFDEVRYLQCFPFAKYIDLHGNAIADVIINNQPVESISNKVTALQALYFCLPRRHIETLIYNEPGKNEITDEIKKEIFDIQEHPLTEFKQNIYSVFDFHRILLTQWDYMDLNEKYDPLNEEFKEEQNKQQQILTQIAEVYNFQLDLQQKIQAQKMKYHKLKELIQQLREERDLFVQQQQEKITVGLAPTRTK